MSRDTGNSDMSKRNQKVLPLSEKVKVLEVIRKEIKSVLRLLRSMGQQIYL